MLALVKIHIFVKIYAYFLNCICELKDNINEWGEQLNMDTMRESTTLLDKFYHIPEEG